MSYVPLPRRTGPPSYDRVLRYTIFLRVPKGAGTDPVSHLDWNIVGFSPADRDGKALGTAIAKPGDAESLIAELLSSRTVTIGGGKMPEEDGLLDFTTWSNTLVVFRLFGEAMWQGAPPAITTKSAQIEPGYVEACGYILRGGRLRSVDAYGPANGRAFPGLAFEVLPDMPLRTIGVNFHAEFIEPRVRQVLPVIIDPDGNNSGKPPG